MKAFLKKYWSIIWLITAIVCATSLIAHAEYDSERNRVRRVVANVSSGGQMFSSNYLEKEMTIHRVPFSAGENGYCIIPVKIRNYNSTNPSRPYQGVLNYELTATLVDSNGTPIANGELGSLDITFNSKSFMWDSDSNSYIISPNIADAFVANGSGEYYTDEKIYAVSFPESMLTNDDIFVKIEANPTNGDINLATISGIFGIRSEDAGLVQGWNGYFSDDKRFTDYDAFNYAFSGNGTATITFQWCSDYLEVNQFNLDSYLLTATKSTTTINGITGNWKTVIIEADANNNLSRYDFQLYMKGDPTTNYGSGDSFWTTVEKYVSNTIN